MSAYTGSQVMGNTDGSAQTAIDFDPKRFYQDLEECYRLQVSRDEVNWEKTTTDRPGDAQVTLNFGCGVQSTPHLMLTQVALFEALGIDYVATVGTKFCCGRPIGRSGDPARGDRLAAISLRRMSTWGSSINVQCCGSCLVQFQHSVGKLEEETGEAPFEVVHITEFLLDTLRRLGDSVPWTSRTRAAPRRVLVHAEGAEVHPTKEVQLNAVIETLDLIPGVEYAGMVENPSVGQPCASKPKPGTPASVGHTLLSDISTKEYRTTQAELLEQARSVGAEAIVTHHHRCHREWSKFGSKQLPVIHYQSLMAEALGIHIPDRFQALWQLGDTEEILHETRPYWQSWGVTEDKARTMVTKFFVPAYAASVQSCPCEGDCFQTRLARADPPAQPLACSANISPTR